MRRGEDKRGGGTKNHKWWEKGCVVVMTSGVRADGAAGVGGDEDLDGGGVEEVDR